MRIPRQAPAKPVQRARLGWCALALSAALPRWAAAAHDPHKPTRQVLVVAVYTPLDHVMRAVKPAWHRLHPDVELRILSRAFEDHHSVVYGALQSASHVPDVLALEAAHLVQFARAGLLEPLDGPPFLAASLASAFVPSSLAHARQRDGQLVALPADIGPLTLLYRNDLVRRALESEAAMTESWDQYLRAGVRFKNATGLFWLPHAREAMETMLQTNLGSGEGVFVDRAGQPLVRTQRFVRAFELARSLRRLGLDAQLSSFSTEWVRALRQGRVATLLAGSWMAGHLQTWLAPSQKGLWRAADLPGHGAGSMGGSYYAIARGSKNRLLAWELLRLMTLTAQTQWLAFDRTHSFPALEAAHTEAFLRQPIEYLGGQGARVLWHEASRRLPSTFISDREGEARSVVHGELERVLQDGKDIQRALDDAARVIENWRPKP